VVVQKPSTLSLKRLACEPGLVTKQLVRGPEVDIRV
jgi:hypothetical protein